MNCHLNAYVYVVFVLFECRVVSNTVVVFFDPCFEVKRHFRILLK
jgi:hypothetical protein